MDSYAFMAAIAIILIVLGIMNTRVNISSLHYAQRFRVSEEDRVPFWKKVGLGTIIIGGSLLVNAGCLLAFEKTSINLFNVLGTAILIAGVVVGLGILFWTIIKYNNGIF